MPPDSKDPVQIKNTFLKDVQINLLFYFLLYLLLPATDCSIKMHWRMLRKMEFNSQLTYKM